MIARILCNYYAKAMKVPLTQSKKIRIPFSSASQMILGYLSRKLKDQLKAVAFIVIYLSLFLLLVFQVPVIEVLRAILNSTLVVLGLALFLEGVFLGLMPLGEKVGIVLPVKAPLVITLLFSLLLGLGSTLAEPALQVLRLVGSQVTPWQHPMLYGVLEVYTTELLFSVGLGVGIAVMLGVLRFYFGWNLKFFIYTLVPVALGLTLWALRDPKLADLVGLAWDAGAVTTGVVTVPLVLALGIGVSRNAQGNASSQSQFGIIMMASILPVLTVLTLGLILSPHIPSAMAEDEFLELEAQGLILLRSGIAESLIDGDSALENPSQSSWSFWLEEYQIAFGSVIPLAGFLFVVLIVLLRDRPKYLDEVILGIFLAFLGMGLLTSGIALGLTPLGNNAGNQLPNLLEQPVQEQQILQGVSEDNLFTLLRPNAEPLAVIPIQDGDSWSFLPFDQSRFDPLTNTYLLPEQSEDPLSRFFYLFGLSLVFLFPFGLGYGSTLAEPALRALGKTVEILTVGTLKSHQLIHSVSFGVGLGLVLGVTRMIFSIPLAYFLLIAYGTALVLTIFIDEEFSGIAWDSGGVTTGPVTVPLVLALGLGVGKQLGISDGFGFLALASAFPIVAVLLLGIFSSLKQARQIREIGVTHGN